jgi:hypothetical protein
MTSMEWGDVGNIVSEVGLLGLEGLEKAAKIPEKYAEAVPIVGTLVNGGKAVYHSGLGDTAEREGDQDKADMYHNKAAYDWLKAVPGVGTALGAGELIEGLGFAVTGGSFSEGMERFGDTVQDIGSMVGIKEFEHSRDDKIGSHTALRHEVEETEKLQKYADEQGL